MFDTKASVERLRAIGLTSSQAHQLVSLVQKWAQASGEQWAVDRVKSIKDDLLRHLSGLAPQKAHSWIHYGKKGPKGPFGILWDLSKRDARKAWNAVMVYTGFVYSHPDLLVTTKQWKKAVAAIKREPLQPSALVEGISMVHKSPFFVPVRVLGETGNPLVDYQPSPSRRAPKDFRTVPDVEGVIDSLRPLIRRTVWTTQNWDILSGTVRGLENSIVPDLELNLEFEEKAGGDLPNETPEMGLIALIQEAGYKLRFAANPYRVYQMALQPLGAALFSALRKVPNDFTFDQNGGVEFIQQCLANGLPAVSMDLSNATDNAPLDCQLELLARLGVSTRWLQFFRDTCRGDWYTKVARSATIDLLRWTVGSPLGLYPTFASFALWHHSVVQQCFAEEEYSLKVDAKLPYAIVGDDVWIGDWAVAQRYERWMLSLGVPISKEKTLWSENTASFVGRVITSRGVIQGFKWKGRQSDESFVDFARNIGPGCLIFMRPRQRRILSFIADLPEPYGLGWNPLGIPLDQRLTPDLERIWSRDERVRTWSRRAARSARLLYMSSDKSGRPVAGREADSDYLSSDQELSELVSEILPGWEAWEDVIWPNVYEIALTRDLSRTSEDKLRLMAQRSSYVEKRTEASTLVVLERKVRRALARSR